MFNFLELALRKLSLTGFDFAEARQLLGPRYEALWAMGSEQSWMAGTAELIPFHLWWEAQEMGRPYRFYVWPQAKAWQAEQRQAWKALEASDATSNQ